MSRWRANDRSLAWALIVCAMVLGGCARFNVPRIDPSGKRIFIDPLISFDRSCLTAGPEYPTAAPSTPSIAPSGYPTAPPNYPAAPSSASIAPSGYPTAPPNYPAASSTPSIAPSGYPTAPSNTTTVPSGYPVATSAVAAGARPGYRAGAADAEASGGSSCLSWCESSKRVDVVVCPREVVSPVGTEVVVLAGVVAADNRLRTNERVEWMIAPGSAGQFVEVGKRSLVNWLVGDFTYPKKIDNTYAIGTTSRSDQTLTRGTDLPNDDVPVRRGQAWITVTSATEGISRVTAYAPEVRTWQRRKQTASIHWIDAQWALPSPSINPAGTRHVFTTTVTRQTDQSPRMGWRVRYEILDGPPAGFAPDGAQAVEVATDESGRARAEILQKQATAGTNRVAVEIIRPANLESVGGKRLVVGRGMTLKTWSAPAIAVVKTGPAVGSVGATLTYRIQVGNPGDLPANEVTLLDVVPPGLSYLHSTPEGHSSGRSVGWQLGTLPPGETRLVEIDFRADRAGQVVNTAEVAAAGGLKASDTASTTVGTSTLDVQVSCSSETVRVGDDVTFRITVANRGQVIASGLGIEAHFDAGLQHAEARSPIKKDLETDLGPGQSKTVGVVFRVTRPGRWCNRVEVIRDGRVEASAEDCVTAVDGSVPGTGPRMGPSSEPSLAPQPPRRAAKVSVAMSCPPVKSVGEKALFIARVRNTGETGLSNVTVSGNFDSELYPHLASRGHRREGSNIVLTFPNLPPGGSEEVKFECECTRAARRALGRVVVTTDQAVRAEDEAAIEIREAGVAVPADLEITITENREFVPQGETFIYLIQVTNRGHQPDHQVAVTVTLPEELQLIKFGTTPTRFTVRGREIRFDPVATIAADALSPLEYRVKVKAVAAGKTQVLAALTSQGSPQPYVIEESTEIQPR